MLCTVLVPQCERFLGILERVQQQAMKMMKGLVLLFSKEKLRELCTLTALSVPGRAVRVRGVWCGPAAKGCGGRGDGHSCLSRFVPSEPKLIGRAPCLCWPVLLRAGSARGAGGGPRAYRGARSLHGAVGGLVEASLKGAAIQT